MIGRRTIADPRVAGGDRRNLFPVGSIPRSLSMTVSGAERSAVSGVEGLRLGRSSGGNTAGLELVETAGQALDSLQP